MYHFLQKLISSLRPSSTNANLLQRVPPFVFYLFYVTYKTGRLQRVPPFNFFSALCEFFFSKIFNFSKESPLRIFWYFATENMLMNPKGSPVFIFRHYATFSKFFSKIFFKKNFQKNFQKFFCFQSRKVIFQSYRAWKALLACLESVFKAFHEYILGIFRKLSFLRLRYSADFRRSRLVIFFRQTADLIVNVPLFSTDFIRFTVNPAVTGSSPCFNQKLFRAFAKADETEWSVPSFNFFSTLCDFSKFFCLQRVPPSSFSFCSKLKCQKA